MSLAAQINYTASTQTRNHFITIADNSLGFLFVTVDLSGDILDLMVCMISKCKLEHWFFKCIVRISDHLSLSIALLLGQWP